MTWDGRQAVFDQDGEEVPEKDAAEHSEIVWSIIEQAMKYSDEHSAEIPVGKSLFNFFEEKVEQMFPASLETDREAARKRKDILQMAEMWGAFVGSPIQTQSLRFFWLEECIDGENLFVAGTYHKILAKIAEPAVKGVKIMFQEKVTKIVSGGTEEDPQVTVELEDGKKLAFDEVVMTAPLGWLKKNKGAFSPELPSRLTQGIDAIGYGHLDKVSIDIYLRASVTLK
jgi:hypothetical protein